MAHRTVGAFEAKTRLSQLLEEASRGRTIIITRRGRPIAELRPARVSTEGLKFGCDKGRIVMGDDFDKPLPDFEDYTT